MNRKVLNSDLFTKSGCLSKEGLSKYLEGSLDKKNIHILEMHILDCQLCSDAIDGFSAINNNRRKEILNDLPLRQQVKRKKIPGWIIYSSVAAAIGIIVTSAILTTNFNKIADKETAYNKNEVISTTKDIPAETTAKINQNEVLVYNYNSKQKGPSKNGNAKTDITLDQQNYPVNGGLYFENNAEDQNKPGLSEQTKDTNAVAGLTKSILATGSSTDKDDSGGEEVEKLSDTKTVSGKEIDVTTDLEKKGSKRTKFKNNDKKTLEQNSVDGDYKSEGIKNEDLNSFYNEGLALFNSSKYEEAIIKFEYLIKMNFNNCDARYYCALSYYKINNSKSALKQLDVLTSDKKSSCYEKARFQKAVILSYTGKRNESDKIFKKIIEEKGSFMEEAEKELNKK